MVGLICLSVIWQAGALPRLFAFAVHDASRSPAHADDEVQPAPSDYSALELAPPPAAPVLARETPNLARNAPSREVRWFGGTKYVYVKTMRMRVTAYAADPRCCWPYSGKITASGESVRTNQGKLAAADTRLLPFHSLVAIPGYHSAQPVPVLDRGGAIKGQRLDVLLPTFEAAQQWGTRMLDVKIYVPAD